MHFVGIPVIAPWVYAPIRSARGFFPLRLGGQRGADRGRVFIRIVPGDIGCRQVVIGSRLRF